MLPALLSPLPGVGPLAFSTAGDAANGVLPFGWDVAGFQTWTLVYLGVSSLAFVVVWLVGYLRR
ncbi:5'-phosphoribosylglycinamide transformylase [Cyanobium sp. N5-Cardenillas]|nr:5'-phosphoribosylglycinamide transformylase [Cyanobium sp. N5-Cardenillas]MCP9786986.1 5'-phosphoribosylglycinamide transformylase [Cyanobium sp. N5-Cardenillas]